MLPFLRSMNLVLGFATPWRLGKHPQRIRGLSAALLLKLRDPVSHGTNHIARRFAGGICFSLDDGADLFALLNYSNCFLL